MSVGRSQPKRRAPGAPSAQRRGVLAALLAVLAVLFVVLLTRGTRAPERRGSVTGPATSPPHVTTGAGTDSSDGRDEPRPSATVRSDSDDGSPRRHRIRRSRAEGAPAGEGIGSASPGHAGIVAGEVGAEDETLDDDQQASSGSGQETAAGEPAPLDPLAFATAPEKKYETVSETDAGKLEGLTGAGGTISFWLQPAWDATSEDAASFVRIGDDRVRVYKSATYLRFEVTGTNDEPIALGMPITDWKPGDWHQVLTTWDSQNAPHVISFFVDGNLVGQNQYEGEIELPSAPKLFVGTNASGQPVARGVVADLRVQNRPLSLADVARRFEGSKAPQR